MILDAFDQFVLEQKGNAKELLQDLYNYKVGRSTAEKGLAAIRVHLNFKQNKIEPQEIEDGELEELVIGADGARTSKRMLTLSEEESKNPKRIMELMGYDPLMWKLDWCKTKRARWDVTMKLRQRDESNEDEEKYIEVPQKHTNHSFLCEIKVSPIQDILTIGFIKQVFSELQSPVIYKKQERNQSGLLLEIQPIDIHLGLLAWGKETEDSDYDIKTAVATIKQAIQELIDKVHQYNLKIEKIAIPIGQDFFHFDTPKATTTAGTQMETDSRWQKMYKEGINLLLWEMENLRQIAPVQCYYVTSNHDLMLSYCAALHIDAYFRDCEDVNVDCSPVPRKYIKWGKCLIGLAHGNEEGKRIEKLMQAERPIEWGETEFREWHLGHLHHESVNEDGGVIIRYLPSLVARDSWHKTKGYIGALRRMQSFVWDKETGKQLTIECKINEACLQDKLK